MATQSVELSAPSGQTVTARLFSAGSDTVVQTASAVTEATNRDGVYTATFTDAAAGLYRLIATNSGGTLLAQWWVDLTLTTATFQAYEMPVSVVQSGLSTFDSASDAVTVGSMNANTVTASALATDAVTEIQNGLSTLDEAGVRTAVGLASANLDTQLADLPTVAEFQARTLVAAAYFDPSTDAVTATTATAAAIADAVWDEATAGHTTAGTYGGRIVRSINSNVGVQITGSNHIAADVHEFQADVLTSDATAASFVTEVQAGLATSEALAVVDGIVDQLKSRSGYTMSILAGAISNAQNAAEAYTITLDGTAYGVTYSGLDSSGNRTGATLTET